ncbi:ParB/RepB/Spo0J family partition protein [Treponema putidum]|uniref:ParB/RepB/Spo0J family partition protein n=1 Tax=Treponema putidum TaxID=221027 RepID=UPI003D94205F
MAKLTALSNMGKTSIANSGASELSVMVSIDTINLKDEFKNLFPLNETMVDTITENILTYGYDKSQPIHVWKDNMTLTDGHHRLAAAKKAGLKEIPVFYHHFKDLEEALAYAIKLQTDRRNLSDAELLKILQTLDQLKQAGRIALDSDKKSSGKSAEITAQKIGVSRSKVEKARTVQNKASEEIKKAVEDGEISINAAYNIVQNESKEIEVSIILEPYTCELEMDEKQVKRIENFLKKENIKYSLVKKF